jgi:antitoxin component YwqK of YwqJK toxin-antitoxin module
MKHTLIILVAVATVALNCCRSRGVSQFADTSKIDAQTGNIRIDTIYSDWLTKYLYYNNDDSIPDSTKLVYYDINMYTIEYNKRPRRFSSKTFYSNGKLSYIMFACDNPQNGDTAYTQYYENGKQQMIHTFADDRGNHLLEIWFYENGEMKKGLIGEYGVQLMPVGLWEKYDSLGVLVETTFYHPDKPGKDYIMIKKYSDGKCISVKKYNNYVQNESDPIEYDTLSVKNIIE